MSSMMARIDRQHEQLLKCTKLKDDTKPKLVYVQQPGLPYNVKKVYHF